MHFGEQEWSAAVADFVFLTHGVPHSYDVVHGPAPKLNIAVPGGIEDFLDDSSMASTGNDHPPLRGEISRLRPIPPVAARPSRH